MTEKIIIEVDGTGNAEEYLKGINQQIKETGNVTEETASTSIGSWTELSSALDIAQQAFSTIADVVKETYGEYAKYAEEVRDLSLISGTGAEATSRFIQVLDDYQLTAQDAETATKKLKDNGLVPTIETLAKLSDQYLAIQDPAEKMAFIQDNLGRGGVKWVNILNQGSEALLANAAAVDKNLILTDEQIAKYEQERLALDALSDSWEGLKIKVGEFFGEAILNNQANERANEILREQGKAVFTNQYGTQAYKDALQQAREEQEKAAVATQTGTEAYVSQADQLKAVEQAEKDRIKAMQEEQKLNADFIATAESMSDAYATFQQKQSDIISQTDDLKQKRQDLINQGWSEESQKVKDVEKDIQDLNDKYAENADEYAANLEKKFALAAVDKIQMEDGVAGFSDAERKKAQAILETTDVATAASFDQAQAMEILTSKVADGKITITEFKDILKKAGEDGVISADEITDALNKIPRNINVTVTVNSVGDLYALYGDSARIVGAGNRRAGGGSVSGGKMYEVTERGMPELLAMNNRQYLMMPPDQSGNVIPIGNGGGSSSGGGNVVVNLTYAPAMSLGNDSELKARLIPIIIQGVQEAKLQGKIQ